MYIIVHANKRCTNEYDGECTSIVYLNSHKVIALSTTNTSLVWLNGIVVELSIMSGMSVQF